MTDDILKESSLRVADVNINHIDPNPDNPNEMDEESFQRLTDEIREVGFLQPIVLIKKEDDRYKILNGEHRWKSAVSLGYKHIPSIILSDEKWNDQDVYNLVNIRLNEIRGKISALKLKPIYDRVVDKYGVESAQKIMGFTNDDVFKKLVKKMAKQVKAALPPDMAGDVDKAAETSGDISAFGKSISKIFAKQSAKIDTNTIIFQSLGKEHIVMRCTPEVFEIAKSLILKVQEKNMDVNTLILPILAESFGRINN